MASLAQVKTKVARLGGSIEVTQYGAILNAPDGMHFDGMHYSEYSFEEGRLEIWNMFWDEMKKMTACDGKDC